MAVVSENEKTIQALDSLLRGELSAVETYDQGISKFGSHPAVAERLGKIRAEHQQTVQTLREHVTNLGGTPSTTSGPWGTFATGVNALAKLIGPEAVLTALAAGEQHGINSYNTALAVGLLPQYETLIKTKFLPQSQAHIAELDSLKALAK